MKNVFKTIAKISLIFVVGFGLGSGAVYSVYKHLTNIPTQEEIQDVENISKGLPEIEREAVSLSRNSAVQILSISPDTGLLANTSGTYFKADGRYFVVTVMHGIVGPCELTRIAADDEFYDCVQFVRGDAIIDYAIIEIEEIENRKPMRLSRALPKNQQWKSVLSAQNKIFYTGFPNGLGPLTFSGNVIGYNDFDSLYVNSYAWGGSSGSGVFSYDGKYVGCILAVDVGKTEHGVDVMENIILVIPAFKIDWASVFEE